MTLKSAIRLLRLLRLKWADFCLRRHHAENAEKEEAGKKGMFGNFFSTFFGKR